MYKRFEKRLALSPKGTKDFIRGVIFTTLMNITLMLPAIFAFIFLQEYLQPLLTNDATISNGILYFISIALGFLAMMWIGAVLHYKNTYIKVYDESATRRISLAEKLRVLPLAFFGKKDLSDLTSTIMEDSTELEHTFSHAVPQLCAAIISISLFFSGLVVYNWKMALALFWVVPIAASILLLSKKKLDRSNKSYYIKKREVTDHIQEGIEGIQEIKSYHREADYLDDLKEKLNTSENELIKGELLAGSLVNSSQGILKLGLASVIITGTYLLSKGSIDLFTFIIFLVIGSRIFDPVNDAFSNLAALFYLDVRIARMNEMQSLPVQQGQRNFSPDSYDISFNNVSFAYEEGKQILKDVSFTAKQGEITALVGPSGGGKTTSAKLAARFWDINEGVITLGNKNIQEVDPETLLQHYSIVFQDVSLFNTSIMDNIRIGRRDATDEEVIKVAKLAQCDEFVQRLPETYNTVIGENGATLSGGERQRISIARALLKDAPIVLLDEATASLDVENESNIQAGISELIKDKTVLIIAHRMRTVANADKIIVLDNGNIIEMGSPEALTLAKGTFYRMLQRQIENNNGKWN